MFHAYNEGMAKLLTDTLLIVDHIPLIILFYKLFGYGFKGVELAIYETADEVNLAEPSYC